MSFLALVAACTSARDVTLTISTVPPLNVATNELTVLANESAELITWLPNGSRITVIKDDILFRFDNSTAIGNLVGQTSRPRFAGPAIIRLESAVALPEKTQSFCTFQITPDTFPPSQALVLPAGPGGANIALEASHDLIHWTNAPPGIYTNPPANLFFRIRADRLP